MAVEAVRQKVSRDLHDDIGSTPSTINILSMLYALYCQLNAYSEMNEMRRNNAQPARCSWYQKYFRIYKLPAFSQVFHNY